MSRTKRQNVQGFTLIETMMAITVLGIALGACVLGFTMAIKGTDTARNQMKALHYTRDELEGLRTYKFTNSVLNAGTYTISNSTYTGYYTVTNIDSYTKNITVGIKYQNHVKGGISTNTLVTTMVKTLH